MILQNVRFDWLFIWEVGSKGKYGCTCLFPKNSTTHKLVTEEIKKQIARGIETGKFTEAQTKSATFKTGLHDGDAAIAAKERPAHYAGMMFVNAYNINQPGIVGPDTAPLLDQSVFYSGCYGHADVGFFPFNRDGGKGIGAGLNHVMLVKQGERLDGRQSAEQAFAGLEVAGDDSDLQ